LPRIKDTRSINSSLAGQMMLVEALTLCTFFDLRERPRDGVYGGSGLLNILNYERRLARGVLSPFVFVAFVSFDVCHDVFV
jgi:hypothetical protein